MELQKYLQRILKTRRHLYINLFTFFPHYQSAFAPYIQHIPLYFLLLHFQNQMQHNYCFHYKIQVIILHFYYHQNLSSPLLLFQIEVNNCVNNVNRKCLHTEKYLQSDKKDKLVLYLKKLFLAETVQRFFKKKLQRIIFFIIPVRL